jgi:hypothetical protein
VTKGRIGVESVERHALGRVDHPAARGVARGVEVGRHLGLAPDHDAPAREALEIDPEGAVPGGEVHPAVRLALAVHARAHAGLAEQRDRSPFEHARPDAGEHMGTRPPLEHHRVEPRAVKELGQQEPRRPATDDADLGAHAILPDLTMPETSWRCQSVGRPGVDSGRAFG